MDGYQSQPWGKACFYFFGSLVALTLLDYQKKKLPKTDKLIENDKNLGSVATYDIDSEVQVKFGQLGEDYKESLKERFINPKKKGSALEGSNDDSNATSPNDIDGNDGC